MAHVYFKMFSKIKSDISGIHRLQPFFVHITDKDFVRGIVYHADLDIVVYIHGDIKMVI